MVAISKVLGFNSMHVHLTKWLSHCTCLQHDSLYVIMSDTGDSKNGSLLFARVVELCQAPVYETQLLLLMIYHHLQRQSRLQITPTVPAQVTLKGRHELPMSHASNSDNY